MTSADARATVGAAQGPITEALYRACPAFRERPLTDGLNVTALYAEAGGEAACLLSYDVCELPRHEAGRLREAVARDMGIPLQSAHVFCTHTHSSSMNASEHDLDFLCARSCEVARQARDRAVPVEGVEFTCVETGNAFAINRRAPGPELGVWCLMQSRGCADGGDAIDGTEWVREKMRQAGAAAADVDAIRGPYRAPPAADSRLELALFPRRGGGYAGGVARFAAHAVICSAGYWRPNLGRDYPGVLCDRLGERFGCPILFVQGPCGDQRPRHRDVGIEERDRIGLGLAKALEGEQVNARRFPLDRVRSASAQVCCRLREDMPSSVEEARARLAAARDSLEGLRTGVANLAERKRLLEQVSFYANAAQALSGESYLTLAEAEARSAALSVSDVRLGRVHVLTFPGELFASLAEGLENAGEDPVVVASFADGVAGYLVPRRAIEEGGYEATWALFDPADVQGLRRTAQALLQEQAASR